MSSFKLFALPLLLLLEGLSLPEFSFSLSASKNSLRGRALQQLTDLHNVTGAKFPLALGESVAKVLLDLGLKNRRIPPELLLFPLLRSEFGRLALLDEVVEEAEPREQVA